MKILLLSAALLLSTAASAAPITKEKITSGGRERTFYLLVPEGDGPKPVVILLHGSGRNGKILVDHWRGLAEKEGIVLAGPDANVQEGWSYPIDGPDFLRDIVDAVKAKTAVDDKRVYLFGHSAGGMFGIQMTLVESTYFAASAIHAGLLPEADHHIIGFAERKIPVLLIVGSRDLLFPVAEVRATREALVAAGHPAEVIEIPRHTHDYYSRSRAINEQAWGFLSQHKLENPKYKVWAH